MIQLHDAEREVPIGTLTERQLKALANSLEEESAADQDYYITGATIDMLEDDGADAELVAMLRRALAGREGMDIRWSRDD